MKLGDLRHGKSDVALSWPPDWGGEYRSGDMFPIGEMGKLTKVEASKMGRGVAIHIEYEGRSFSGVIMWNGEKPTVEQVIEILNRHAGRGLKGLGDLDLG